MGIRLYPQTTDHAKLEKLAHVPEGTWQKYAELEKAFPDADAFYDEIFKPENAEIRQLQSFDLNGYGRIHIPFELSDNSGKTKTLFEAQLLAIIHEIDPEIAILAEGFKWC